MNYLRGAVSAISAPYHYYNQINPSTLTGAIDVIVVKRPAKDGGMELACSPFHVRFGKWQVLRPSDKRVNISVNGMPIPYDMKIGDAGEAFFVFETGDDVPEDLITSPLLLPTRTEGESAPPGTDDDEQARVGAPGPPDLKREGARPRVTSEPDYFDLDALPQGKTPKVSDVVPVYAQGGVANVHDDRTATMDEQDRRVDEALHRKRWEHSATGPEVQYRRDVALDIEGYHASKGSEQTPRRSAFTFPSLADQAMYDSEQEPPPHSTTPSMLSSSNSSDSGDLTRKNSYKLHPSFRATSEPPPDITLTSADEASHIPSDTLVESSMTSPGPSSPSPTPPPLGLHAMQQGPQEYSWEWGGFPTPSPMKGGFLSAKGKGKQDVNGYFGVVEEEGDEADNEDNDDDKHWKRGRKRSQGKHKLDVDVGLAVLVARRFKGDQTDPTRFVLDVDGEQVLFELSLVDQNDINFTGQSSFYDLDTIQAARVFDQTKITFQNLLDDDSIIKDERLMMRWAGYRYIVCCDNAQIMEALINWRIDALEQGQDNDANSSLRMSRPEEPRQLHARSKSSPPEEIRSAAASQSSKADDNRVATKSSKLSWVPWWSGARKNGSNIAGTDDGNGRPQLRGFATAPAVAPLHTHEILKSSNPELRPKIDTFAVPISRQPELARKRKKYAKTLRLTSDQLKALHLKPGTNTITFSLSASGTIACTARIFVWEYTDQVLISDIDGTITKSDGLGHVFAMIGRDWTHLGVAKLYSDITRNGYKILYLTSRAIGQADSTRYYLKGIKQNDYQLPEGPVIMSPDRLMASLHREVIMRKPEVFKMACLRDIRNLFGEANRNPFYAGFGNRITDALSYRSVAVPSSRIFTIDSSGEVRMELLELAGYKSSYIHMTDLVDQMFPPINKKWSAEYTDFNYWRTPIPDISFPDLAPPSPTLSARSDGSTRSALARLRNFSLVGGSKQTKEEIGSGDLRRNVHARLSSLERLSSSLVDGIRRSMSPDSRSESSATYASSDADSEGEWEVDADGKRRRRLQRRQSIGSMPGTLDDMHFFGLDEYDEGELEEPVFGEFEDGRNEQQDDELYEEDIVADEQALEEDLFAAGEMQNVPFL